MVSAAAPDPAIGDVAPSGGLFPEGSIKNIAPVTATQVQDTLFASAKEALSDYVANNKENGREKAIEMLKALGVSRLTELDANGLQKFLVLIKP